jgi:hypothetical protein
MTSPSPNTEFCAGFIASQIENTILGADMDRKRAASFMIQCLYCLKPEIMVLLLRPEAWLTQEGKRTLRDVLLRGIFTTETSSVRT